MLDKVSMHLWILKLPLLLYFIHVYNKLQLHYLVTSRPVCNKLQQTISKGIELEALSVKHTVLIDTIYLKDFSAKDLPFKILLNVEIAILVIQFLPFL